MSLSQKFIYFIENICFFGQKQNKFGNLKSLLSVNVFRNRFHWEQVNIIIIYPNRQKSIGLLKCWSATGIRWIRTLKFSFDFDFFGFGVGVVALPNHQTVSYKIRIYTKSEYNLNTTENKNHTIIFVDRFNILFIQSLIESQWGAVLLFNKFFIHWCTQLNWLILLFLKVCPSIKISIFHNYCACDKK